MEMTESVAVASDAVSTSEKFSEYQVRPVDRTRQDRFHRAALFFAGGQVHRRVHRAGHAHQDHEIGNQAAVGFPGYFLRETTFCCSMSNGFIRLVRQLVGRPGGRAPCRRDIP